jgi:tetratricopeptide (TPR) repeat protein
MIGMSNTFSQEITNKEKKGDKQYFLYNYDEAIQAYNSSKTLTVAARRRLAESHVKMENFAEAEVAYAYLVNNQDAVIHDDYYQYAMVLKSRGKNDDYAMWMNKLVSVAPSDLRGKCYTANHLNYPQMATDKKTHKVQSLEMNSDSQDYGTAFYKDQIVFTSTKEPVKLVKRTDNWTGLPYSSMYLAKVENNQFKDIQFFDKKLNSKMHDGPASFNADGTKMAFTTNNQKDKSKIGRAHV